MSIKHPLSARLKDRRLPNWVVFRHAALGQAVERSLYGVECLQHARVDLFNGSCFVFSG